MRKEIIKKLFNCALLSITLSFVIANLFFSKIVSLPSRVNIHSKDTVTVDLNLNEDKYKKLFEDFDESRFLRKFLKPLSLCLTNRNISRFKDEAMRSMGAGNMNAGIPNTDFYFSVPVGETGCRHLETRHLEALALGTTVELNYTYLGDGESSTEIDTHKTIVIIWPGMFNVLLFSIVVFLLVPTFINWSKETLLFFTRKEWY